MQIAYVFDENLPSDATDTEQVMNTLTALGRRGVRVNLVLPWKKGRPEPTADSLRAYYGLEGDVQVTAIPGPLDTVRVAQKWGHAYKALKHPAVRAADVVYTRNLPALTQAVARRRPVVFETYRRWPVQYPALAPVLRRLMAAKSFRGGLFHSDFARQSYVDLAPPGTPLEVMYNGFNPGRMWPPMDQAEARAQLGLPTDRRIVAYTGHINPTKGLDVVLEMAARTPEVLYLLVGSQGRGPVEREAEKHANVQVAPWMRSEEIVPYLFAADVLILPPSLTPLQRHGTTVLPMKVFVYLAAGRVVFAPHAPDTAELLRDDENAALTPPNDVDAAVARLRGVLGDDAAMQRIADGARATAESLTWDARAERIQAFLERVMAK